MKKLLFLFLLIFVGVSVGSCQDKEKAKKYRLLMIKDDWKTNSEKYLENKQYVEVLYFETDSIPNWIDKYENLETIGRFETRKINYIPSSISNLKKLKSLVLAEAKLDSLPKFIGNITSLEKISIHDNNLQNPPNTIRN